jgi:hypothetical protein
MMTKTNLNRCSRLALAAVLVLAALAAPAAAVSVGDDSVPAEAEAGTQVEATVTLTELYRNPELESWELSGETELTDVTWTVVYIDQTGSKVDQESSSGQNLSGATVAADDGVSEVEVRITGTVPPVDDYTYDPPQTFTFVELTQSREGGASNTIETYETHHYTAESREARTELDEAAAAIESANADTEAAERSFDQAVNAYEGEEFDLAVELANQATEQANSAQQSRQTRQTLIYAGVGVVVLALLVGGFLYWRSQQETYDKLG